MADGYAGDVTPEEAWEILSTEENAVLIDCRTAPEWSYVGNTDLSSLGKTPTNIEWKVFPAMEVNPDFEKLVSEAAPAKDAKLLFLCRSGVRSIAAAQEATKLGYSDAYNILEGFEGDKNDHGHRGHLGGWKVRGLPWTQG